ncbi:uncharacterized protein [Rutidosis leptorrhynchoides]|uniref:uncharacterized protein n=1 Tax=Rutidosis leptorrhynchoides TaxID=125765 RepID=UPI003A990C35
MRAGMVWTINDFPAYANLSGWSTKGKLACPSCHKRTRSIRLRRSRKFVFMGHRRLLSKRHAYRKDKNSFDGTEELETKPTCLTGSDVLNELNGIEFKFGKLVKDNPVLPYNWKKRSIFFKLPWKDKRSFKWRYDLEEMGIRKELHTEVLENNKVYLPPSCFSMNKKEKDRFCRMLKAVKLLPICIRNSLPKHVRSVVINLCRYYRRLCCKVLDSTELVQMENDIGKILCDMERIFPPSFFDVMVHLSVHLAYEARIGGPVHYRWMYPIERYLATLKSYVRNRSKPEGSISEGYLADECLSFCSLYFADNVETIHNKKSRNYDDGGKEDGLPIFSMPGRPIGARKMALLSLDRLAKVRKLHKQGVDGISEDLRHLANGPSEYVTTYKGYIVNGYRFQTKQTEKKRKIQNSGVMLEATTNSFSSVRDKNPIVGAVTYYEVLKEIIELQHAADKKEDKEPFKLASQAQQVFYVKDCVHKGWKVVIKTKPRDSYEMDALTSLDDVEIHLQIEKGMGPQIDENVNIELVREDIDGIVVDNITTTYTDTNEDHLEDDAIID